jgi:hypothetical protein
MNDGDIYDIGETVNGVSRFLYLDNKWYYARSLVYRYNYDESQLIDLITLDEDESVKLIGNIFTDDELRLGLDFSQSPEILSLIRERKINELGIKEYQPHCYICYTMSVDEEMICDRCEEIYCEDCSYTFSLHYQHQGSRCYHCADQSRRTKLDKRDITLNKVLLKEV